MASIIVAPPSPSPPSPSLPHARRPLRPRVAAAGFNLYCVVPPGFRPDRQRPSHDRLQGMRDAIKNVEGEMLIEGAPPRDAIRKVSDVHSAYIPTAEQLQAKHVLKQITEEQLNAELKLLAKSYDKVKIVGRVGRVGRVVSLVGVVFTAYHLALAAQRSQEQRSYKPLAAETIRQVGGWGAGLPR